jgi:bacterioferritin-associated ferredoxin
MDACNNRPDCSGCSARMICHCLQITREMLHDALVSLDLHTLHDVRRATGAGDGCTACHRQLRLFLEQHRRVELAQASSSPSPI